jgi:4-amino-4-deoxy-L-arabinose transferase-like glycosyltransferase
MPTSLLEPLDHPPLTHATEKPNAEKARSFWPWGLLFGLTLLVYLGTTGLLPLVGRDEPRYVQIGREMLDSGNWVTPRLGGFTWFEKPVLLYWMVAASFSVFGVNEWAARLGPALCGLGTIGAVWWMVRRVDEKWARWSALSLATSGALLAFSHAATFDIPLTACVTLALAGFFMAQVEVPQARRHMAVFWVGVGLAFMAKGLVAFILTLGTLGFYALLRREKVRTFSWWGLPLALAVSALWYGPVIWANGQPFVHEFFVEHHFARYLSDKYKHHQPVYFYLEILPLFALPWTPFLLAGLWKTRLSALRQNTLESKLQALALAWMIVPVAFFSLSGSKLPGYILPAIPGAFLLVGMALKNWTTSRTRVRVASGLVAAVLLGTAVLTTTRPGINLAEKASVRKVFAISHQNGFSSLRVVQFETMQRTAQFYAASRLVYDHAGEPLEINEASQIAELATSEPLLVLVELDHLDKITALPSVTVTSIANNGKIALVLVRHKP